MTRKDKRRPQMVLVGLQRQVTEGWQQWRFPAAHVCVCGRPPMVHLPFLTETCGWERCVATKGGESGPSLCTDSSWAVQVLGAGQPAWTTVEVQACVVDLQKGKAT